MSELVRGKDGLVRSAHIRTRKGETTRPIVKLFPLEEHVETNNSSDGGDTTEPNTSNRVRRHASVKARDNIRKWINGSTDDDDL